MLIAAVLKVSLVLSALADSEVADLLARAERLAKLDQGAVAAGLYGKALAHKALDEDLLAQGAVADVVRDFLGDAPEADTLAALMAPLPAKHNGVFVSASGLARALAFEAIASGDVLLGKELGDVLASHAKLRHGGAAAKTFALVGEAISRLSRFEAKAAVTLLERALKEMIEQGWHEAAVHVGTELAAQHVLLGNDDDAREVIESLAALFPGGGDLVLLRRWTELVAARLSGAPGTVLRAERSMLAYLPEEEPVLGGQTMEEGDGAGPGTELSAAAEALASRRTVELLSLERDDRHWVIRSELGKGLELTLELAPGVIVLDHEGLLFALDGPSAAVLEIQRFAGAPVLEAAQTLGPGQARYLLADGEILRLDSRAGITVR